MAHQGQMCGGVSPANPEDEGVVSAFKKALELGNEKNSLNLQFVKVLNATSQVVAGAIYEGDVETSDGVYHVKLWSRPWLNAYELQEFKKV